MIDSPFDEEPKTELDIAIRDIFQKYNEDHENEYDGGSIDSSDEWDYEIRYNRRECSSLMSDFISYLIGFY